MAAIAIKLELSIKGEYNALKEVEDGNSKSKVTLKYGIPNKEHLIHLVEKQGICL